MWNLQSWEGVDEVNPAPRRQKLSTGAELGIYCFLSHSKREKVESSEQRRYMEKQCVLKFIKVHWTSQIAYTTREYQHRQLSSHRSILTVSYNCNPSIRYRNREEGQDFSNNSQILVQFTVRTIFTSTYIPGVACCTNMDHTDSQSIRKLFNNRESDNQNYIYNFRYSRRLQVRLQSLLVKD